MKSGFGKQRKGAVAITTLILALLGTAIVVGGVGMIVAVDNLIQTLLNRAFYIILGAVVLGGIGYFSLQAYQDKIPQEDLYKPIVIIVALAILGSMSGVAMSEVLESYTATVEVSVSQSTFGTQNPKLEQVSVNDITRKAPGIFGTQTKQACIAFCDGWEVEVEVSCDGNVVGTQTLTGKGQQTVSTTFRDLQEGQCKAVATPGDSMDGQPDTAHFAVG